MIIGSLNSPSRSFGRIACLTVVGLVLDRCLEGAEAEPAPAYLFTPEGDLQWLRHVKGTNIVLGRTLCLDRFGNLLLAGELAGNLSFESDRPTLSPIGSQSRADVFLAWYDREGNFRGVREIGSPASEGGFSLTTGGSGHVYLTGQFGDYFLTGDTLSIGPTTLTSLGRFDFYLAELAALPPVLRVVRSSGDVVISWPSAAVSYVLQTADSLASPHWNAVTNGSTSGGAIEVHFGDAFGAAGFLPAQRTLTPAFFRLGIERGEMAGYFFAHFPDVSLHTPSWVLRT